MQHGIEALRAFAAEPAADIAARLRGEGCRVIRVLGTDAPCDLLRAAGLTPVRMVADISMPTPRADALIGTTAMSARGRSLLEQILADASGDALLITHGDADLPQLFAALRAMRDAGELGQRPIHFLDLLHMPRASTRAYNRKRLDQLVAWLGAPLDEAKARADAARRAQLLAIARETRVAARLSGAEFHALIVTAHLLPLDQWFDHAEAALAEVQTRQPRDAKRLVLTGVPQPDGALHAALDAAGYQVVVDAQDWGDRLIDDGTYVGGDWLDHLADPERLAPSLFVLAEPFLATALARASTAGATHALHVVTPGDEAAIWDAGFLTRQLAEAGLKVAVWNSGKAPFDAEALFRPAPAADTPQAQPREAPRAPRPPRPEGQRSRKSLQSVATFGSYQREWFASIREAAAAGSPFAVVNANSPQEMLRALDIPFVVNQWWASIVAAKQQSRRYFGLLKAHGYPSDVESYSAQGIAALFDEDEENAPWGGLPRPDILQTVLGSDATIRIFDHWTRESGADLFLFERSIDPRLDIRADWWDCLHDDWDSELEAERLDLLTDELRQSIAHLEQLTGKRFDAERFRRIMDLVNEQEDYYRKTRDLIARTVPAPVGIVDTMPATMVPQWHRGTEWARDAAKAFYEEVKARVDAGEAACANERIRLMWIGRGLWSDMSFYQKWEESHGAVFVWSMYLSLAADGYIRKHDRGRDPLRALAGRFVTMGDELRMPTWAGAWHVREVETHGIDGAVALSDADPFVIRALEKAGIPVLALDLDNYNQESSDAAAIDAQIEAFLDGAAGARAKARAAG